MAEELSPLEGFSIGDTVQISDPITQEEFGAFQVDFRIVSVRTYADTQKGLKYLCYVLAGDEEDEFFMLVVKETGCFYDIMLYYLDNDGHINEPKNSIAPDYSMILDPDHSDFADVILIANDEGEQIREIQWNRKEDSHMDMTYYDEKGVNKVSVCEYFTDDENYGNDSALISCKGDFVTGHLEMWYGYLLQNHEVELVKKGA